MLLDGFLRVSDQVDAVATLGAVKTVLFLDCTEDVMVERLSKQDCPDEVALLAQFADHCLPVIDRYDKAGLARRIDARFSSLQKRIPRTIGERSGVGAMQAFSVFDGSPEATRKVLDACFEEGLILLTAGSSPTKLRMLPPVNVTDEELEAAFAVLEKALRRVAEEFDA